MNSADARRSRFFDQGLLFTCRRCGDCCTGAPGTIYLGPAEIDPLAAFLGLASRTLIDRYCYPFRESFSIREDRQGRCLFFRDGCTVYPVRPLQCRTFPFWFRNLRSEARWRAIERQCPGIGQGRRYGKAQIESMARATVEI